MSGPDVPALVDDADLALIGALQDGLPLVERPYAQVGAALGHSEAEVMRRIRALVGRGVFKRFGVVVRHHELGYRANAMVVWNVPDPELQEIGRRLAEHPAVTLCYRRPRRPPYWPYNLYCMLHGRSRDAVLGCLDELTAGCGMARYEREVLFSTRRFKQNGAHYCRPFAAAVLGRTGMESAG